MTWVTARVGSPLNLGQLALYFVEQWFGDPGIFWTSIEGYTLWNAHDKSCVSMVPLLRVIPQWSHQMNFMKVSSRVEGELPSSGVTKKSRGKVFGNESCQNVVREWKRIQNPPRKWQNCVIAQVVCWENIDPTTKWWQLRGHLPTITLGRCPFTLEVR